MAWKPIETVTQEDAPFSVRIDPVGDPDDGVTGLARDCSLDATGAVVNCNGDLIENATHWRPG